MGLWPGLRRSRSPWMSRLREGQPGRAPVNDHTHRGAVALAPGRDGEELSERVGHLLAATLGCPTGPASGKSRPRGQPSPRYGVLPQGHLQSPRFALSSLLPICMTMRPARLWLALGFLAALAGLNAQVPPPVALRPVVPAVPAAAPKPGDNMVDSFKLSDGDIDAVLSALEIYTGRTVVRPGQLPDGDLLPADQQADPEGRARDRPGDAPRPERRLGDPHGRPLPQGDRALAGEERGARDDHRLLARPAAERQDRDEALRAQFPARLGIRAADPGRS